MLSLFLAGLSLPMARVFRSQIEAIDPLRETPGDQEGYAAVHRALQADSRAVAVRSAVAAVAAHRTAAPPDFARSRRADPQNGLYDWLDLLLVMRQHAPGGADASAARGDAVLQHLRRPPPRPARLYHSRQREIAERTLRAARGITGGEPHRPSAAGANRVLVAYSAGHRPAVRELIRNLTEQAAAWRAAGRPEDARAAATAGCNLLLDLLSDSPTPDVALLVAELLPEALGELALSAPAKERDTAADAAQAAVAFATRWHDVSHERPVNLIPWTGDVAWSEAAHDRLLRWFLASGLLIGAWLTLALLCGLLVVPALFNRRAAAVPGPPAARLASALRSNLIASLLFIGPLILLLVMLLTGDLSFTWLFSYQSVPAVALLPALVPVMLGLAARLCAIGGTPPLMPHPPGHGKAAGNLRDAAVPVGAMVALGLLLVTAVAVMVLLPIRPAPWQPPAHILFIRRIGLVVGVWSAVAAAVWIVWGWLQRRRAAIPAGPPARANLAVAASSLLLLSLLGVGVLAGNQVADRSHQAAFTQAAADPISDRLGPDWSQRHFQPARALLGRSN